LEIEQIMVADNVIFFKSPEIPNKYISDINARKYKLRLKRKGEIDNRTGESDETYSNAIDFNVRVHDSILLTSPEDVTVQECLYCSIEDKSSLIPVEVAKPGEKKRGTPRDNKRKIEDFDVERDVKNRRLSGGSSITGMSPDSGRGPSPPIFPDVRDSLMDVYEEDTEHMTDLDINSLLVSMATASDDVTQQVFQAEVSQYSSRNIVTQVNCGQVQVPQTQVQNYTLQSVEGEDSSLVSMEIASNYVSQPVSQTEVPDNAPQFSEAQNYLPQTMAQVYQVSQAEIHNYFPQSSEAQDLVSHDEGQVFIQVPTKGSDHPQQLGDEDLPEDILQLIDELPPVCDGHKPGAKQVDGCVTEGKVIQIGVPWWHKYVIFFLMLLLSIIGDRVEEKDLYSIFKKTGRVYSFVPVAVLSVIFLFSMLDMQHLIFPMIVTAVMMIAAFQRFYRPVDK